MKDDKNAEKAPPPVNQGGEPKKTADDEKPDVENVDAGALMAYLTRERGMELTWGMTYDTVSDVLTVLAVLTPFAVAMLLMIDLIDGKTTAIISAAIPGAAFGIIRGLKTVERGKHHMAIAWMFSTWVFQLQVNKGSAAAIAKEVARFLKKGRQFPSRMEQEEFKRLIQELQGKK